MPRAAVRLKVLLDISEPPQRSGQLHKSQSIKVGGSSFMPALIVEYKAPQANYTDEGTRPHEIVAKRAKVLRFKVGGKVIYRKRVSHPGNKPTRWFRKTVTQANWNNVLRDVTS